MTTTSSLLGVIALLLLTSGLTTAATKQRVLVVLSDSLSDNGNGIYAASNHTSPSPASYWRGRFSNGPNWSDYLLRRPFDTVLNFAYGGAGACPGSGAMGPGAGDNATGQGEARGGGSQVQPLSVVNQAQLYLSQAALLQDVTQRDSVVLVWIGGNDLNQASSLSGAAQSAALDAMVSCINTTLTMLVGSGETRLVVGMPTIFGIGQQSQQAQATSLQLMDSAAAKLQPVLAQLQAQHPGVHLAAWDVANFTRRLVLSRLPPLGFTDTSSPCLSGSGNAFGRRRVRGSAPQGSGPGFRSDGTTEGLAGQDRRRRRLLDRLWMLDAALSTLSLLRQSPLPGNISSDHCGTPNQYLYWDSAHPTTAAHLLIARHFELMLLQSKVLS